MPVNCSLSRAAQYLMYAIPVDTTACLISTGNLKSIPNMPLSSTGEDFIRSITSESGKFVWRTDSHRGFPGKNYPPDAG